MPVELNDLILKRTRKLEIPVNDAGESFTIEWNPSRMTQEVYARLQEWQAEESRDPFETARVYLAPLMTGWDITVDGKPYAVTAEHIAALGLDLVGAIGEAINTDYALASDTKKGSGAPS